jgi:hypothetical protein
MSSPTSTARPLTDRRTSRAEGYGTKSSASRAVGLLQGFRNAFAAALRWYDKQHHRLVEGGASIGPSIHAQHSPPLICLQDVTEQATASGDESAAGL